jgi:threonine/homoserine/homoserine lactone efflux protein
LLGACSGDALWAALVSLGVGVLLTGPRMRVAMGCVSIVLLLGMAFMFLRGAWRAWRAPAAAGPAASRFDGARAGYLLGATMALTSPWNLAFWLAAIGRPELTRSGDSALPLLVAAVIAGALTWGLLWCGTVVLLRRRTGQGGAARWWDIGAKLLTGALMLLFAARSAQTLLAG